MESGLAASTSSFLEWLILVGNSAVESYAGKPTANSYTMLCVFLYNRWTYVGFVKELDHSATWLQVDHLPG